MYRDPSKFKDHFKLYKEGKSVREIYGLPGYAGGKFDAATKKKIDYYYKKLRSNGFDMMSAIGILGNMMQESSFNPDIVNHLGYHGLLLNSKAIQNAIKNLYGDLSEQSLLRYLSDWTDGATWIRKGPYASDTALYSKSYLRSGYKTPEQAAYEFLKRYERAIVVDPKTKKALRDANGNYVYLDKDKRLGYAKSIYNYLSGRPDGIQDLIALVGATQPEPIIAVPDATRVSTIPTIQLKAIDYSDRRNAVAAEALRAIWAHNVMEDMKGAYQVPIWESPSLPALTPVEYDVTPLKTYAGGKLPKYQGGLTPIELQIVDNQGVIRQGYPEIPIDKARAWSDKKYTGNSGETFVKNFANNLINTIQDAVGPYREALNLRLTPQGAFRILMDAGMSKAGQAVGKLISDAAKPVANAVSKSESVAYLTPSQMGRRIKENPQLVSNVNVDDAIKDAMWFHENLVLPAWESRGVHIGLDPKDFSIKQADFGDSKLGAIISEDGDIILNSKLPPKRQALVIEHEFGGHGAELLKRKIKKLYPKQASLINKWDAKDLFLVNQAYNYSDEFLTPRPGFPKAEESVVLNREVQYLISRDNGWAVGPELLLIIKLMPRARLRRYYAEANAYGKEIIKNAKDPDLMPQRTALMNVPVFGGGLYLANTDPNEYKNGKLPGYSNGKIRIKPANRGKFNATKKRTGKTTEELTHSKNPLTRKRAIFAQNARKWKH